MAENLFGVPTELNSYNKDVSKDFVLQGISESLQDPLNKARGSYTRSGLGRFNTSLENKYFQPIMQAGANQARTALTDLFYRDPAEKRAQETHDFTIASEKKKQEAATVLCTALYYQGLLSLTHVKNDLRFLKDFVSKEEHEQYLYWATPIANEMMKNKSLTYIVFPFIYLWSYYMNSMVKGSKKNILFYIGRSIHRLGLLIGKGVRQWAF